MHKIFADPMGIIPKVRNTKRKKIYNDDNKKMYEIFT